MKAEVENGSTAPLRPRKRHRDTRLELTSLMDVMFLVLAFFIYCIFDMTVHNGVKVDLPITSAATEKGEKIIITIKENDAIQLNGEPTTCEAAVAKVQELYNVNMKLPILVSGDKKATLGTGVKLLSELKKIGVGSVSFQVKGQE